jgi:hypothetical protein
MNSTEKIELLPAPVWLGIAAVCFQADGNSTLIAPHS